MLFDLVNSAVADVSRKKGVDYHFVEALIDRYVETSVDFSRIEALGILGIDEISMKKGYCDFVTLVTYRINDKVHILSVIEDRKKVDIASFLRAIPQRMRKTICAVCCDLYDGYMNACKEVFKKTPVVADRFHVRKLYRKSLITLRKTELNRLRKELSDTDYDKLKPAMTILRKQKDCFTKQEKPVIDKLFSLSPKLKLGYKFSRDLTGIFDSHISPELAKEKMAEWATGCCGL